MNASEVLRAAHTLIEQKGWTADAHARDAAGNPVAIFLDRKPNPAIATLSIYGALALAGFGGTPQTESALMWDALRAQAIKEGARGHIHPLVSFNDREGQTQEAVLAFLLDVASACEKASSALAEARAS